nr:hypothetical protein [Tanacetum cinerariifolium]
KWNNQAPTFAKILILDTGKFEQWKFRIQQYLHNEHYALWEVIEFGDSYEAPQVVADTGSTSDGSAKKKGRTVAVTTEDMQKKRNDVKARTTLLLALPDEHQLRFSNSMANSRQKGKRYWSKLSIDCRPFLTPEWLMYTTAWRNRSDIDTMSLDDLYNHLKVYEPEVQKKSESNFQNMAFISSAKTSSGKGEVNTASFSTASTQVSPASVDVATASFSHDTVCAYIAFQSNGSQVKYKDINQIDKDDIEEMDSKWNMALLSMRVDRFWKKTRKKIIIQGTDVDGFDKSKKSKIEEQTPKVLMAIDRVGWDQSYMANEEEDNALVADQEALIEFALMAKSSSDTEVFDNSLCSKACKKNTSSLNTKITELSEKLNDTKTTLYHYKLGLSQVKARLVEFKNQEIKLCEKIKGLELNVESKDNRIERLAHELEELKNEKEGLDSKLTGFQSASKDLDTLLGTQRPSLSIESNSSDFFVSENGESSKSILSKPMIKFVKAADSPTVIKNNKVETDRKPFVKYAEMYRDTHKSPKNVIDDKGYWDSGRSRHMTGNISYLSDYEPYDGGYVSFRQGGGKITGKGVIKTSKLKFKNVYFMKDLKYNLFSVSQICDNKNNILFTDSECIVLGRDFKLKDDTNVLLRTPRQHNMYSIDLNNIFPHKDLICLVSKASADESVLCHRRLGHLNFKIINKLVRHNLVRGLPSKYSENYHTCDACLKGKQHKASCKTKLVHLVSKPLHTLHIDLFGPTYVSSLNYKWYCLVVTDDFSRFTWTFSLKTKDETSGILRNFITDIENLKELKNGVAKRRNRTLIEAARTMFADAKLHVTFWAKAVNTACYVQNRVLVNKSQNKTPYELFNGRTPAIGFLKPFGCHVMILNTLDHLGKLDAKGDEGYFIRYFMSSKVYRVFNKRTKIVEENLHVDFLENKLIEKGAGLNWLFDIDTLTNSMNYVLVVSAGTTSTNFSGTKDAASQDVKKDMSSLRYIALLNYGNSNPTATSTNPPADQMETLTVQTPIPTVSSPVLIACLNDSPEPSSDIRLISKRVTSQDDTPSLDNILTLSNRFEDILGALTNSGDTNGVEADIGNLENNISASPTHTLRIHKDHPTSQIIDHVDTPVQTRTKSKEMEEQSFIASIHHMKNPYLLQFFLGKIDQTLFIRKHRGDFILVQVYVDDIIFGSSNPQLYKDFEALMHEKFQMSTMGELNFFLGLQVLQKKDGIFLSQDKYVGDIFKKFRYSDVRLANTPMDKENPWGKKGSVKRIFRYLKGHPKLGIWYPKDSPFDMAAYSDSDYGGATQDRKLTTRGGQFLDRRLISWKCKKKTIMATSTTEAEYVVAASGYGQVS